MNRRKRYRIRVYGIVQGIGFRPFVSRLAEQHRIAGSVCNKGSYVEIHAEAAEENLERFERDLTEEAPAVSAIIRIEKEEEAPEGDSRFSILRSVHEAGEIFVSPDLAICPACQKELLDPENRRYLHPFINCTDCGPRLTILDSMPYDRIRTSMHEFPMCARCEEEYTNPESRRFHAQPVCCHDDGPQLSIPGRTETRAEALRYVRSVIRDGGIAAVKGIGGFHLCCDAGNPEAVRRLRALKNRPKKPFAVMMKDLETVRRECVVLPEEEKILTGVQRPILLLKRKPDGLLCEDIAPGNPTLGVMLPYAPLHLLLFEYPDGDWMTDALIMTSGNPGGAPICRTEEEAVKYLTPMCDVILSNDRKIRLRSDDSVLRLENGRPYMIRRSRGYAPLPFPGPASWRGEVLAVGGELKNTFVLAKDKLYYPSPYIGDLADLRTVDALASAVERMERLLEIRPSMVVCDLHPRYNSTAFAEEQSLPLLKVQHHYAHILSCMGENEYYEPVIGVAFDGTGYGTDGTIWGGEFLHATLDGFERLGSLRPFWQAGGDAAAKEGWRIAVSLLYDAFDSEEAAEHVIRRLRLCSGQELAVQRMMRERGINRVKSSSAGRLFDAVSAILGIRRASSFEGEASMALEFAADPEAPALQTSEFRPDGSGAEPDPVSGSLETPGVRPAGDTHESVPGSGEAVPFLLDWRTMIRTLAEQRLAGVDVGRLAGGFHTGLAEMVLEGVRYCRSVTGVRTVALSGGVFQNMLLLRKCRALLERDGFRVLIHSLIPANDGGIALGQALAAMARLNG